MANSAPIDHQVQADRSTLQLVLSGYGEALGTATVELEETRPAGRVRRALLGLATAWGLAGLSVFIPVAHFLLVPGFLLGGVILAARRIMGGTVVVAARGTCPDCGLEQELVLPGRWKLPCGVPCGGCQRQLTLRDG